MPKFTELPSGALLPGTYFIDATYVSQKYRKKKNITLIHVLVMAAAEDIVNKPSSIVMKTDNASLEGELSLIRIVIPPLSEFCDSHEVELDWMLRLAWSLVQGIYTGTSNICFRCIRRTTDGDESPLEEWVDRVDFDRSTPIIDLLKRGPNTKPNHNGDQSAGGAQDLALELCDTIVMLNISLERAFQVLGVHDMANVSATTSLAGASS